MRDWEAIAYLIGWLLAWALSWLPTPARAAGFDDVAVRVTNQRGAIADVGSGTLVAGDGTQALVITCSHIFRDGAGQVTVERPSHHRYPARLLGVSRNNDVAAVEIPDPGVRTLRIADRQPPAATFIGWGDTNRAWKHRGQLVEQDRDTVFYSFSPIEGDSGGGVFDDSGAFAGVVWGTDGYAGATVPLSDLREALASPTLKRYWRTSTTKEANPMFATPIILAGAMLAQSPPLPGKNPPEIMQPIQPTVPDKRQPRATPQATPQATPMPSQFVPARQFESQQYAYQYPPPQAQFEADIPIRVRVRVIPEIEASVGVPRQQSYAPAPAQFSGGGGCYGGSFSAGSYGVSRSVQAYEMPGASIICSGGRCFPVGERLSGLSAGRNIKIKNKSQSGRGGGLLGLNWFSKQ